MVPTRSTLASFVYGSSGFSRTGASASDGGNTDGTGVEVMSETKPVSVEPTTSATRPMPPVAANSTPAPRPTTAATNSSRNGRARRRVVSTRRWDASRFAEGARVRAFAGAGRPVDGGRGRTWDGRPFLVVIGLHCYTRCLRSVLAAVAAVAAGRRWARCPLRSALAGSHARSLAV